MRVFAKDNNIFKFLSEAFSEGLLVFNRDSKIVATNKKADKMFGYRREELIDQPLIILIPDSYKKDHHKHVDEYFKTHKSRKLTALLQ